MKRHNLNLARRPFVNQRPVVRVSGLLWTLGILLLLANGWLYWSFYQGQEATRTRLAELGDAMDQEQERIRSLEQRLAAVDLEAQNEQVAFLNQRIERRTFGWSVLFDTLAEVLPRDVRLTRLRPERRQVGPRRRPGEQAPSSVPLSIEGQAKSHEDLYVFLDSLYASPAFRDVDPQRETQVDRGMVTFALDTIYLPREATVRQELEPEKDDAPSEAENEDAAQPAEPVRQPQATSEEAS